VANTKKRRLDSLADARSPAAQSFGGKEIQTPFK
jgi:hypothetical protein